MNNIPYIDILILAMIAIFIINRLKNVLGKKPEMSKILLKNFLETKQVLKNHHPIRQQFLK